MSFNAEHHIFGRKGETKGNSKKNGQDSGQMFTMIEETRRGVKLRLCALSGRFKRPSEVQIGEIYLKLE